MRNNRSAFLDKLVFFLRQANESEATPVRSLLSFNAIRRPRPQFGGWGSPEEVLIRTNRVFVQDGLRGIDLPVFQLNPLTERALAKGGIVPEEGRERRGGR